MEENAYLSLFEAQKIRRIFYADEWFLAVVDVIAALTDSKNPRRYWSDVKRKMHKEGLVFESYEKIVQLKIPALDGKKYATDCANTEGILRIIMSVSSPKAEGFKQWLSQVGREHLEETADPELGFERLRALYQNKGYSNEWIERRLQSIEVRKQLTDEWKNRGIQDEKAFALLTAEIAKATFGLTPSAHKTLKGLDKENLRDHMTPLELIFTALGEEVTRTIAIQENAQGFMDNLDAAQQGGALAGKARQNIEEDKRIKVVSAQNFIQQIAAAEAQNQAQGLPEPPPSDTVL